jgi:xanthine dehydrogenase accessory factor
LTTLEAQQLDAEEGAEFRLLVTPAEALPTELWEVLIERRPVQIVAKLDQDRVTEFELGPDPSSTSVEDSASAIRTSWSPTPLLVVLGAGPMATAIADAGQLVGWRVETGASTEQALGLAASLSPIDSLVVMGHNTENVGRVLQSALGSRAGYIGSVGPASLQEDRGDWLAYRGITDTSRIHGPAGVPIGANSPGEIAISVLAEALAVHNSQGI